MLIMSIGMTFAMFMLTMFVLAMTSIVIGFSRLSNYLAHNRTASTANACANYSTSARATYFTSNYGATSTTHRTANHSTSLVGRKFYFTVYRGFPGMSNVRIQYFNI